MVMRPDREKEMYGYRLKNYFTGEVVAERRFDTREAMEQGLAEDLAPANLLGNVFHGLTNGK